MNPKLEGLRTLAVMGSEPGAKSDLHGATEPITTPARGSRRRSNAARALEELLDRVCLRDPDALEALYDQTSPSVMALAERLLKDPLGAEEVVLDVYQYAWRRAALYDPKRGSVLGWLLTITRARAIDRARAVAARRRRERGNTEDETQTWSDPKPGPAQHAADTERGELLGSALAALPERQRRAIEEAFLGGRTHEELAQLLGEPLGTIKSLIRRGLMKLHERAVSLGMEA